MKVHNPQRAASVRDLKLLPTKNRNVLLLLCASCLVAMIFSIGSGSTFISPPAVIASLLGVGSQEHAMVIQNLRLPRMLVALMAGASLAASGAIFQSMIRNPLASPDVLGVTGGASVAAVIFLHYLLGTISIRLLPVAALLGAVLVAGLLYTLAWKRGVTAIRLVLVGVGVSGLMSAMTTLLLIFNPRNEANQAYFWLTGSVYGSNWESVLTILPWTVVLLPLAWMRKRQVNVALLGDDLATGVGSAVERNRLLMLLLGVGLAGSAVAVAGGIGFVGLVAPHMARKLVGVSFGSLLPTSALLGGIIVVLADLAGRTLLLPLDIPAGVFTSAVGAPFFIYLLYTRRNTS